jgi:hypothetical protein
MAAERAGEGKERGRRKGRRAVPARAKKEGSMTGKQVKLVERTHPHGHYGRRTTFKEAFLVIRTRANALLRAVAVNYFTLTELLASGASI